MARLPAFLSILALLGCDGAAVPSTITGEPTCPNFMLGPEKMRGGLKQPVRLKVLSGDTTVATVTVFGVPAGGKATRFLLPDVDAEYSLEWSQCPNQRAPSPESAGTPRPGEITKYECGEATPYATVAHTVKKGDRTTHDIPISPVPDVACWEGGGSDPRLAGSAAPSGSASAGPAKTPSR